MKEVKGFTLIEILMVVTVMGILASVLLSNLHTARLKGIDAMIKQTLSNMSAESQLYVDSNGSYTGMCENPSISEAISVVNTRNASGTASCIDGDDMAGVWAIEAQLVASTSEYFCIDYSGNSNTFIGSTISTSTGFEDSNCGP